jgi:hypothetical protein
MAIDHIRPSKPEAQRMTKSRDVMMFSSPASAVAMGNAGGQLKCRASTVNDCFDDQGLGEAVERCVPDSETRSR